MNNLLRWGLALLLVVTTGAAVLLTYRSERNRVVETLPDPAVTEPAGPLPEVGDAGASTRTVKVYFFRQSSQRPGRVALSHAEEELVEHPNPDAMALTLARAALTKAGSMVGPGAAVEQVFLLEDGTAVVDLGRRTGTEIRGSAACELGLLQGIARSLTANLEEVKAVRFLLGGHQASTLAGHISLNTVFR